MASRRDCRRRGERLLFDFGGGGGGAEQVDHHGYPERERVLVEPLSRKPARMHTRPSSSPTKKSDVMPKRVRPLARLGTNAPAAMSMWEATRLGCARERQKSRALAT